MTEPQSPAIVIRFDNASANFCSHLRVLYFGIRAESRRVHRIEESHLQFREAAELLTAGPRLEESLQRNRYDRTLGMNREDSRALLEQFGRPVDAALAFREEHEYALVAQTVGSGTHGWHEVGVGIDGDQADGLHNTAHQLAAENLAGAHIE